MKNNFWKISTLVLFAFLVLISGVSIVILSKRSSGLSPDNFLPQQNSASLVGSIEPVSAEEIYPLFECSCCGKAINQCTCPMAKERMNYVDALVETNKNGSKDEIVSAYVRKYGLNSFIDKEEQKEFREKLIKEAPADRPIISLSPSVYDFGDVSQKAGVVITFFEIKNEGKSNLVIDRLETSCGCTSASVIYQGKEGPKFNMPGHDINEKIKDWQVIIAPGEEVELKVYYDPNMHKDFRGSAIREISVFSNDPIDFEKGVNIELNQID